MERYQSAIISRYFQFLFQAMQWKQCPWKVIRISETTNGRKVLPCCHWDWSLHFEQKLLPLWLQCDRYLWSYHLVTSSDYGLVPFIFQDTFFSFSFLSRAVSLIQRTVAVCLIHTKHYWRLCSWGVGCML